MWDHMDLTVLAAEHYFAKGGQPLMRTFSGCSTASSTGGTPKASVGAAHPGGALKACVRFLLRRRAETQSA